MGRLGVEFAARKVAFRSRQLRLMALALAFNLEEMQVVRRSFPISLLLSAVLSGLWMGQALAESALGDVRPRPLAWAMAAARDQDWDIAARLAARDEAVAAEIIAWMQLQAGDGSLEEAQTFLERRADWPRLAGIRKAVEPQVAKADRTTILQFFANQPAQTTDGALAHAAALRAINQPEQAQSVLLAAWLRLSLNQTETNEMLRALDGETPDLAADRMDAMLWRGWHDNARRLIPLVSRGQKALAEARIGLQRQAGNVDALLGKVPDDLRNTPGLQHARFEWRVRKGRWADAKALLLQQSASEDALGRPEIWANRRRALARDELRDGTAKRAYDIASKHFLTRGSHYADLEWLSGYIALTRLNDPARALEHFNNHDAAVTSPISQGRAGYWQGRAHLALGAVAAADQAFTMGAAHQSSFYGLLAAEAAGLPFDVGLEDVPRADWRSGPLAQDSLFQAGLLLAASGERNLAEVFWSHLAEQLGETDAALLGQAAIDMEEPHLAVMIGKAVARRGAIVPVPYYPLHPLTQTDMPVPTELALAIARRESEFDPVVVSGVGARGLMQLMPATAREVARDLGLSGGHSDARLTQDPVYNARLGTQYLAELSAQFDRNIVMVAAGYNAGPSRPIRWMRDYGDPRGGDIEDLIDWIEGIPFRETRNYVMRVAESLPIFRARLGQDPLPRPFSEELLGASLGN